MRGHRADSSLLADESLLAGLAVGDYEAGVAFVRRFQRRVYGLALKLVGDPAAAEDIAQEALVRAWRHAQAYDARRGSVTTWLLTITRNLAIDALRVRRALPTDPDDLPGLVAGDRVEGPAERAVATDEASKLREVIGGLPVEQRRALVLAAFYGRTAREISDSEGIPLGTAKTRIRSAMLRLRAELSGEAPRWA